MRRTTCAALIAALVYGMIVSDRPGAGSPSLAAPWRSSVARAAQSPAAQSPAAAAEASAAPTSEASDRDEQLRRAEELDRRRAEAISQRRVKDAIDAAREVVALRRGALGDQSLDVANSLDALGMAQAFALDYRGARASYDDALAIRRRVGGDSGLETARSYHLLGMLLDAQGDYAQAQAFYQSELAILQVTLGAKHPDVATALSWMGLSLRRRGQFVAARPLCETALEIRKTALGLEHPETARALVDLGYVHLGLGEAVAQRQCFEQALAIQQATLGERHLDTALTLESLGTTYILLGDFPRGQQFLSRARAIREALGGAAVPSTPNGGSDFAAARREFERQLAESRGKLPADDPHHAYLLGQIGAMAKAIGDYPAARASFEQALAIRRTRGPNRATAAALHELGELLAAEIDPAAAQAAFEQELAIRRESDRDSPELWRLLLRLGRLLADQGKLAAAVDPLAEGAALAKAVLGDAHPEAARACAEVAETLARQGRWRDAARHQDESRRIVRSYMTRLLPALAEQEQLAFLKQAYNLPLDVSLSLGWHERDDPKLAAISAGWLLNGKAVAQEALGARTLLARQSPDSRVAALAQELQQARERLAAASLAAPAPDQVAMRRERLAELAATEQLAARRLAEAAVRAKSPLAAANDWTEIDAVRRALPADGALVEFARFNRFTFPADARQNPWAPARYAAWILPAAGAGDPQLVDLGAADEIDAAVVRARSAMQQAMGDGSEQGTIEKLGEAEAENLLGAALQDLGRRVFEPVVERLGAARRLILAPDAQLWFVPWGALPLNGSARGKWQYALERFPNGYAITGRDLVADCRAPEKRGKSVVMADPNFDLDAAESQAATRAVLRGAAPAAGRKERTSNPLPAELPSGLRPLHAARLPGTAAEAKAIAGALATYARDEPITYTGKFALEGVFKAVRNPTVVVLSTHGFFLPDDQSESAVVPVSQAPARPLANPLLRCGLLLAGCNQSGAAPQAAEGDDGVLTGLEILGARLRGTELVVLSACETGLGEASSGEGVAGLRQAFQLAGARAVVATLWRIPDRQSAQLMTDFFASLAAGQPKADALRDAQLAMIQHRRDKYGAAHPFFWAAYTLTGESLPLQRPDGR